MPGFQIFLHALRMVLGNLGAAIRITIPILVYFVLLLLLGYTMFGTQNYAANWTQNVGWVGPAGAPPAGFWLFFLVAFFGGIIAFLWTATAWHRFILLEEVPGATGPVLNMGAIGRYLMRMILLGILLFMLIMVLGVIAAMVSTALSAALPPTAVAVVIGLMVYLPVVVVAYRLSPVLPAAAIGEQLGFGQAWSATRGASGALVTLAVITVLAGWALQQPITVLMGPAPLLGSLLTLVVQWVSSVFGISIMTTIYGHYVQRRELNA